MLMLSFVTPNHFEPNPDVEEPKEIWCGQNCIQCGSSHVTIVYRGEFGSITYECSVCGKIWGLYAP
jgi:hypothetical protein